MNALLEDRVTVLEGKVERLEANPQPGQNKAFSDGFKEVRADIKELRTDFKQFGNVQAEHSQALAKLGGDLAGLAATQKKHSQILDVQSGKLNGLSQDLTTLSISIDAADLHVSQLRDEFSGRMDRMEADVAGIKGELAEFKVEVKGALTEILDRLPPKGE